MWKIVFDHIDLEKKMLKVKYKFAKNGITATIHLHDH